MLTTQRLFAVNALAKLRRFLSKPYRDSYLQAHVRSSIPYQIQALREKEGLTQEQLAQKMGTTQSVVARIENPESGRASVQTLLEIASATGVALLVRFVSYPEFLERARDMSPQALKVDNIDESVDKMQREILKPSGNSLLKEITRNQDPQYKDEQASSIKPPQTPNPLRAEQRSDKPWSLFQ